MPLRVLSYNIQNDGQERLPLIANVIRRSQPDAVALLEANSRPNAEWLARELDMHLTFGDANSEFSIAWLSRVPLMHAENRRLPVLAKTLLEIELSWERAPVRLFATHLRAGREGSTICTAPRRCARSWTCCAHQTRFRICLWAT